MMYCTTFVVNKRRIYNSEGFKLEHGSFAVCADADAVQCVFLHKTLMVGCCECVFIQN